MKSLLIPFTGSHATAQAPRRGSKKLAGGNTPGIENKHASAIGAGAQGGQLTMELPEPDPLELQIQRQWARNEALHAEYWTDERRACWWAYHREDWPASLPAYKRTSTLHQYLCERATADANDRPMRTVLQIDAATEEDWQRFKSHAAEWAVIVREDFKAGRPCSIRPEPQFESLLDYAIHLAGIPIDCAKPRQPDAL